MESHNKYDKTVIGINKYLLRFLMGVLTICIICGSADLVRLLIKDMGDTSITPLGFLDIKTLLSTFSPILTIAVGYELVKSLHTIISSPVIPAIPLVQIGIIALSNKMITIDFKTAEWHVLLGMAAIMISLGVTFYLMKQGDAKKKKENPLKSDFPEGKH